LNAWSFAVIVCSSVLLVLFVAQIRSLERMDKLLVEAHEKTTDLHCGLILEVQRLRDRIERLDRHGGGK